MQKRALLTSVKKALFLFILMFFQGWVRKGSSALPPPVAEKGRAKEAGETSNASSSEAVQ
jgi:hypothetical protein